MDPIFIYISSQMTTIKPIRWKKYVFVIHQPEQEEQLVKIITFHRKVKKVEKIRGLSIGVIHFNLEKENRDGLVKNYAYL